MLCFLFCVVPIALLVYLFRTQVAQKRVTLVVLGDIGRSPRMQYHAQSFAKEGFDVDFIGYGGSTPHPEVVHNKKIHIYHLKEPPASIQKLPRLIVYFVKVLWRSFALFLTLLLVKKPSYMLSQNPPAIPTLAICVFVSVIRGTRYIIDWHNYGYTILGLTLGEDHLLVKLARCYENLLGGFSHANICVTQAMREDLKTNWKIQAVTMYDRPPSLFRSMDILAQHKLFSKLAEKHEIFRTYSEEERGRTIFTKTLEDGSTVQCENRPALLVSSTSWTEDEDFSILLNALQLYENSKTDESCDLPKLVCIITGKGPLKERYEREISKRCWEHVSICTPWLEAEDYPKLLGSADLGVCLHKSSSGLDLPMKVVDMFGCGLPVCAVSYNCIGELVKHEKNGLVFKSDEELASQLQSLLSGFPHNGQKLKTFREELKTFQKCRWDVEWKEAMIPLLH